MFKAIFNLFIMPDAESDSKARLHIQYTLGNITTHVSENNVHNTLVILAQII